METMWLLSLLCLSVNIYFVTSSSEQGAWEKLYSSKKDESMQAFARSMYNQTKVKVAVHCKDKEFHIRWILRRTPCAREFQDVEYLKDLQRFYLEYPNKHITPEYTYKTVDYRQGELNFKCDEQHPNLGYEASKIITATIIVKDNTTSTPSTSAQKDSNATTATGTSNSRRKRSDKDTKATTQKSELSIPDYLTETWRDGYYLLVILIESSQAFNATVNVEFVHDTYGKISAVDWPLLVFFGVMGLLYIILGLLWLVLLACNWRDLLRIQFWIGGVLVLGMLESAVFFGEYENLSKTGSSVRGAIILGELVSALKRTLARMLVIIVSLGFGIVKPRLGQAFHKVLCVGGVFFILSSVDGCMRAVKSKNSRKESLLAAVPLAVVDAVICWWIFSALVQTTRTLRLRRNIVKLSLYRHFTNTLIFAVLASIAFMIWSITQHKMQMCLTDWKELWVDEAFWHLLFLLILFIIMLLWRPSTNNQRYAFSPLLDAAEDDDEEENVMHDAYEGMKMRGTKSQTNGAPRQKDLQSKAEDDLKWVEENIPSSVADKALPSLLDSDEEIMTTKFEMSKME